MYFICVLGFCLEPGFKSESHQRGGVSHEYKVLDSVIQPQMLIK